MRSKQMTRRIRGVRRHRLALALVGAMAMPMPVLAQSLPEFGDVVNGTASIGQTGTQMTITQNTQGAIIDWGSFNIGTGYAVNFDQQFGNTSVTLNRVIGGGYGGSMSTINGSLTANGSVFIINPAGIVFGSGAQVNVGGLVASTLDISNGDFLSGLSSGQFDFSGSGSAGEVVNYGSIRTSDGGTIALIGAFVGNHGVLEADVQGSVLLAAMENVTLLDYFGDGLTQIAVSGNGLSVQGCTGCASGIASHGEISAFGGSIEMHTNTIDGQPAGSDLFVDPANGGRIWISGQTSAYTDGSNRGSIVLDARQGNVDLGGEEGDTAFVSVSAWEPGEQAGTIWIRGSQLFTHLCVWTAGACVQNNQLGFLDASSFNETGGSAGEIHIDVGRFYHAGVVQASALNGPGGLVDIRANSAEIYNLIFAEGYGSGAGGTIDITANSLLLHRGETLWIDGGPNYSLATLSAFGYADGGTVNIDAGSLTMVDLGNVSPEDVDLDPAYRPTINVNGYGGDGGSINVSTTSFVLSPWQYFEATGTGLGGNISIDADLIDLAGGLVATGGTAWGTVTTTATSSLFAQATAYIQAGTWMVHAPSAHIVSAIDAQPGSGAVITDAALSATLDQGTVVQVFADDALYSGASGDIHIDDGVSVLHGVDNAAGLELHATGGIFGSGFAIDSTAGTLDLSFLANVDGDSYGGTVSFYDIALSSSGGDITIDGNGGGAYLQLSQVSSGGGDITVIGHADEVGVAIGSTDLDSAGGDIAIDGSNPSGTGVRIHDAGIASGDGAISIQGDGIDGVSIGYSDLVSTGGNIAILGDGEFSGVYFLESSVVSDSGDIGIDGQASLDLAGYYPFGVALAGSALSSSSGDIGIDGEAPGGSGILFWESNGIVPGITTASGNIGLTSTGASGLGLSGLDIATEDGDITIVGTALDDYATAAVFIGSGGLTTDGGDISITGNGGQTGVWLYYGDLTSNGGGISVIGDGALYGVQSWNNLVSSGDGDIGIVGTVSGSGTGSTGVNVRDAALVSTGGDITVDGSAPNGTGVFFGGTYGGTGSSVTTTSGAISVISTGLQGLNASDVPFATETGDIHLEGHALGSGHGLYLGSGGLTTSGGDISLVGSSADGAGVLIAGGDIASGGGDIAVSGQGVGAAGVILEAGSSIDAGAGVVVLRAGNDGGSDAISIQGSIASDTAVNLRPIDEDDAILLGAGNGFSLIGAELSMIDAPLLVIGSASHAGAIRVTEAQEWDGDLTLQNQGGDGGISLEAAVNVGEHTLALASGGDIDQSAAGAITAHSLLAIADGNVSLTAAENDVAADSLAGSAGGSFAYRDVDDLAIGDVASSGYEPIDNVGLVALSASGITAGGSVLVQTASGNLLLGADVSGSSVDLVAAETFQNPAGHLVQASQGWRIWARTWEGETRGGLEGDGPFDVFGCGYGQEGCTGLGSGNQFIYLEQRFTQAPLPPQTAVEWLDDDDAGSGAEDLLMTAMCPVGDIGEDQSSADSAADNLGSEWLRSRHRMRLNNCIDGKRAPGCRF